MDQDKDDIVKEHVEQKIIVDYSIVPEHVSRQNSEESHDFEKAKRQLKKDGHTKCFICGCESTPDNRIEYHHFLVESCFNNVADMEKMWQLAKIFDVYGYAKNSTECPKNCNHPMNLISLCKKHHTQAAGIHSNTFSTFIIQKLLKDGLSEDDNPVPQNLEELKKLKEDYENKFKNK